MLDLNILYWIQNLRNDCMDIVLGWYTTLGNSILFWCLLVGIILVVKKTRQLGVHLCIGLILELFIVHLLIKPFIDRPRPFEVDSSIFTYIDHPLDPSFPSGHTAIVFLVVSCLYFSGYKKTALCLLPFAILMGFTRMYFFVHYPSDVLCGAAIGICCGYIAYRIKKHWCS